jgi:hypothetical protein
MPAHAGPMTHHQSTHRHQARPHGHPNGQPLTAAATMPRFHLGPVAADPRTRPYDGPVAAERVPMQGGVFGCVASSGDVIAATTRTGETGQASHA